MDSEIQQMEGLASQKVLLNITLLMYRDTMVNILANPSFIPAQELQTHHEEAIHTCLEAINKVKPLNQEQMNRVKEHLETIYEDYKKTNEKKNKNVCKLKVEKHKNEKVPEEVMDSEIQQTTELQKSQEAREKTQLEFISVMYTDTMVQILANPRFIPVQELHNHHEEAIQTCLEAVNKVKPLTQKQINRVRGHLATIYEDFMKTNEKKLQTKAPAIGIDLGTTYCCVAYFNKDSEEVEVVPNEIYENTTPSYVQLMEDDDDIVVGMTAKDTAYLNPQGTIFDIKRMCGRHFEDEEIQKLKKYWPFQVVQGEDGKIKIRLGKEILYPEEVLVNLVNHLKEMAEEYLNETVVNAVVTIPAYFTPRQKTLTNETCNKAGLNIIRFISEPAAAAVAYGMFFQHQGLKRRGLIFDLGGGTFDVAILELENKKIKILATDGDPYLGGEDFDNSLLQHCVEAFKKEHGVDLVEAGSDNERFKRLKRMKMECEIKKCYLSASKKVLISKDGIYGEKALRLYVTRDEFSELIKPYVDKCMKVVDQVLAKCQLKEADIDDVMLVGGSTRTPYVQERLSEKFGGKKLLRRISPEEAPVPLRNTVLVIH